MEIFLFTLAYIFLVFVSVFIIIYISQLLPILKEHKLMIDNLEADLFKNLRELQFKSKILSKAIVKIKKQKKSIVIESLSFLLVNLLPFRKLKNGILIFKLIKNLAKQ